MRGGFFSTATCRKGGRVVKCTTEREKENGSKLRVITIQLFKINRADRNKIAR